MLTEQQHLGQSGSFSTAWLSTEMAAFEEASLFSETHDSGRPRCCTILSPGPRPAFASLQTLKSHDTSGKAWLT